MEAWLSELRPYRGEPGTSSGWRLAKSSWKMIRTQPAVRGLSLLLAVLLAVYVGLGALAHFELNVHTFHESLWPLRLAAQLLVVLVANMSLIAVLAAADASLDGMQTGVSGALAEARDVVGSVVVWSAISTAYFVALSAATRSAWLGLLALGVWYVVSFFVLPSLLIDQLGAFAALATSTGVLRRRWRAVIGVGLWALAVLMFAFTITGFLFVHAGALNQEGHGWRGFAAIGLIPTMVVFALVLAAQQIASLTILRDSFDDLRGTPWPGPRRGRAAKVLRVCGGVLVFFVLAGALTAATKHDRKVLKESREPGANYSIVLTDAGELPSGSPVVYEGRQIGVVLGTADRDDGLDIRIHVDPGYGPETTPGYFSIEDRAGKPSLVLEPSRAEGSTGQIEAVQS